MMKSLLAVLLFVAPAFAQAPAPAQDQVETALIAAGCGPSQVMFDLTVDKNQHPLAQLQAGKALVYVINSVGLPMKIGLDGSWVGANRGVSYFSFPVDPGDHHLCMSEQGDHKQGSAASFTAAAGQAYYFRSTFKESTGWELKVIDPARGLFLIASSAHSTSHPKK
jgi:hypothetical protein